jgi:hypothetical protein
MLIPRLLATALLFTATVESVAQSPAPPSPTAAPTAVDSSPSGAPAAQPADVASPEAIIKAVYSVISGAAGEERDWPRLMSLMAPGATFSVTSTLKDGAVKIRTFSVGDYIVGTSRAVSSAGFYERGVTGPIWRYAHMATVSSPYESRHTPGETPFQRGINVFQLAYDGSRWWIVSIAWEGESAAFPLPPDADALLRAK